MIFVIAALLAGVLAGARISGARRWERRTWALFSRLEAARVAPARARFDPRELDGLPAPVQRYFRSVLHDGQRLIAAVRLEHAGTFNSSEAAPSWKPFTSRQRSTTHRPGFVWNGSIAVAPGATIRVHDAYVAGEGLLHATLWGLVTVMKIEGTPEVAEGEFLRYAAETPWYPTALLPSQGARWEGVDERSARVTLSDGTIAATLTVRFDDVGLIESVRADSRPRTARGRVVRSPWEGRFWGYERRHGMLVPSEGEVAWLLPEGRLPYWRGRVTRTDYELAP